MNTQMVNIGIKLIKKVNDFERGFTTWYKKPTPQHTNLNFKTHFEREYQALKKVRDITMRSKAYVQQANAMASVLKLLQEERSKILTEVQDTEINLLRTMEQSQSSDATDNRDAFW